MAGAPGAGSARLSGGVRVPWRMAALALSWALAGLASAQPVVATVAASAVPPPTQATVMVDLSTGTTLFAERADLPLPPASMAKLMTVYSAFAEIAAGRARLDQPVTVSARVARDWGGRGSTMDLKAGQVLSVAALLDGIIGVSGNDAAEALAEGLAGSTDAFLALGEGHRVRLGLAGSRFRSVSGWPDGRATATTAADMARLAAALRADFPDLYARFFARRALGAPQPGSGIDRLVRAVSGADGLKTGTTDEAGNCVAMMAERDGRRLALVITGRPDGATRMADAVRLFDHGFGGFAPVVVAAAGAPLARAELRGGRTVALGVPADVRATLPVGAGPGLVSREVTLLAAAGRRARPGATLGWLTLSAPGWSMVAPLVALGAVP